jgi:endonuclease/exonuclease/phosphatase family metal-dependent hydrolase
MDNSRRDFLNLALSTVLVSSLKGCYPTPWIRIASHNIANARGNTDDMFVERSKSEILANLEKLVILSEEEGIDLLCMNETDYNSFRTHNIGQAEYIKERAGYNYVLREVSFDSPPFLQLGNAIVSKYPLELVRTHQYGGDNLDDQIAHTFKSFIDFNVFIEDEPLNVVFTHLDSITPEIRLEEAKYLVGYLQKKTEPFVLLGDFNSTSEQPAFEEQPAIKEQPAFKILNESGLLYNPHIGLPTYPSDNPKRSIDHIWISQSGVEQQMEIKNYHVVSTKASDHGAVIADIRAP